jgi:hypothetical protein
MKKVLPFIIVLTIIIVIIALFISLASTKKMIVIQEGNKKQLPIEMKLNMYQDSDCGMVIESLSYASQVISNSGKTWFFHDHGGFIHWLKDKEFKDDVVIWVMSLDTKRWIKAQDAFYSLDDITPMGYGFGAYEHKKAGHVGYEEMKIKMLRGETMNNPIIRKKLLEQKEQ